MTDEPDLDTFDRDLHALLQVDLSPDFMAAVRTRIEATRPARGAWRWLAPALAAGVALALLVRAAPRTTPAPAHTPRTVAVAPRLPAIPATPQTPRAAPVPRPAAPRLRREAGQPEVIVPPDEERALLAFVAAAGARGERRAVALTASATSDAPIGAPAAIDIAPLDTSSMPEPAGLTSPDDAAGTSPEVTAGTRSDS